MIGSVSIKAQKNPVTVSLKGYTLHWQRTDFYSKSLKAPSVFLISAINSSWHTSHQLFLIIQCSLFWPTRPLVPRIIWFACSNVCSCLEPVQTEISFWLFYIEGSNCSRWRMVVLETNQTNGLWACFLSYTMGNCNFFSLDLNNIYYLPWFKNTFSKLDSSFQSLSFHRVDFPFKLLQPSSH